MTLLAPLITGFLRDYMPRQRGYSPHSCETYAHGFRLLFAFVAKRTGTMPSQLQIEQLEATVILDFLARPKPGRRRTGSEPRYDRQLAGRLFSLSLPHIRPKSQFDS